MLEFRNLTELDDDAIIPYMATTSTEQLRYNTSRFHSYNGTSSWVALNPNAVSHHQAVRYDIDEDEYVGFSDKLNRFSDARYSVYAPEYALASPARRVGNILNYDPLPWMISNNDPYLFFNGIECIAFRAVSATPSSVAIPDNLVGRVDGILVPLRLCSVIGSAQFSTNLRIAQGQVRYEFQRPRDYTNTSYTVADFPVPRSVITRNTLLPDSQFLGVRVRGRRGTNQTKDNIYQATYGGTLDVHNDYKIKSVLAKALVSVALLNLPDDENVPFAAMLESDIIASTYTNYQFNMSVTYSRRTLA